MIEFPIEQLREIAKAATHELDYWRELFDAASGAHPTIPLAVVAVVLNAALEADLVQLVNGDEQSDPPGYMKGWKDGRISRERELVGVDQDHRLEAEDKRTLMVNPPADKHTPGYWESTPNGNVFHANAEPEPPDDLADAGRPTRAELNAVEDSFEALLSGPDGDKVRAQWAESADRSRRLRKNLDFSDQAAAILGPEHTLVTPLVPRRVPDADDALANIAAALATGDGAVKFDCTPRPLGGKKRVERVLTEADGGEPETDAKPLPFLPSRKQLLAELQRQAMGGVMPTQSAFDAAKPANWGTGASQCVRLQTSWVSLAHEAGLKPNRPGRK